jgi:hypothetical protein
MARDAGNLIMLRMTASIANASRVVLVPARASRGRDGAAVRRYRLARLRVEGRAQPDGAQAGASRHDHLTRSYD